MSTSDLIATAAAVLSLISLATSILFSVLGRRYTKQQIKQATDQIDETKKQFRAANTPDVEVHVYYQGVDQEGVYAKATNHHPTITVNDLMIYLVGDSPSQQEAFSLMFLTFGDLKPMATIKESSLQELRTILKEHFPEHIDSEGALISEKPMLDSLQWFPIKLHHSFIPRFHGAEKISVTRELQMGVRPRKAADVK